MRTLLLALLLVSGWAAAGSVDTPGEFDYYVFTLSWSPQYCAGKGNPNEPQCARPYGFVVHGLWPQNERGYPERCGRGEYLSDRLISRMLPLMPSKSLIIHEWQAHGVCSGLDAAGYFAAVERASASVKIPARYQQTSAYLNVSPRELEQDFIAANPRLSSESIAVNCGGRYLREVRFCLTRELKPRDCSREVHDACGSSALLRPVTALH